ncbi:MAG TPA: COX15/CtaA family protein [Chthoniobacterales bacterium]|nr:COX15/CtaA family protein [Chthoniobacterales bacterium]
MSPNESALSAVIDRRHNWLHRFAWFTSIATLLLICSGGMVTSKGVGLAVPDWPTTFGYNMFLFPVSKWVGGIFFEHTHRLIASTVGFLTIILAVWIWRADHRRWMRRLGFAALGAVVLQGVLGGLRVTMLKDEIGIFHALLAQAFFGILIVITLATSRLWDRLRESGLTPDATRTLLRIVIGTTVLIYLQLGLGATMRHQHRDLSILDFPLAYGAIIPDTTAAKLAEINAWRDARALSEVTAFQIWLQLSHRFMAVLIAAGVIASSIVARRTGPAARLLSRFTDSWFLLLACQITLGAWVIWSNKAADVATTHVAVGATMFALGVALSAVCLRLARESNLARSPRHPAVSMEIPVS